MISRQTILLFLCITFAIMTEIQAFNEVEFSGHETPMKKRFRAEPVRFGKRAPREPVRFGKRSSGQLFYPFDLLNNPA